MKLTPDGLRGDRDRAGRRPGARRAGAGRDSRSPSRTTSRSRRAALYHDAPIGLSLNGGASLEARMAERLVTFEHDGAIGTDHAAAAGEIQRARHPDAARRLPTALDEAEAADARARRAGHRRGQGLLRRRRHRGLGGDERRRFPGAMGALRPSRLRPAGAAAAADHRRAVRPCAGRRAGACRRLPISASPNGRSSSACPKPRSAWCPAGRARSAPCAASARRRCGAWRSAARSCSPTEALALGIVDRVVETGAGLDGSQGLGRKHRRARPAGDRSHQADDRHRRRRGQRCARRGAGQRLRRLTGDLKAGVDGFQTKQKRAFSRRSVGSTVDERTAQHHHACSRRQPRRRPTSC